MKRLMVVLVGCMLMMSSCATIAYNSKSLEKAAQLNSVGQDDYIVVKSITVMDKAGWVLGIIPANKPAGDNHEYFAEFLERIIDEAGGDAIINLQVKAQFTPGDILINIVTLGGYLTRTVTVTGDIIKYR